MNILAYVSLDICLRSFVEEIFKSKCDVEMCIFLFVALVDLTRIKLGVVFHYLKPPQGLLLAVLWVGFLRVKGTGWRMGFLPTWLQVVLRWY